MSEGEEGRQVEILLVEDSPSDVRLTREALDEDKILHDLHVARTGEEALAYLRREGEHADASLPDLVLLDLHLPGKSGREVLAEIRADPDLARLPVVVLTSSQDEEDILAAYDLHVNCYVRKPVDLDEFIRVVQSIREFWFTVVVLPPREGSDSS